ncbi:MAG: YciI family protein [Candidatus Eisenbacteria bacterium]
MLRRFVPLVLLLLACGIARVSAAPAPAGAGTAAPVRRYVLAILRSGHASVAVPSARLDTLRAGHMANIRRMFSDHRLVCAGPFLDDGELQGIYLFDADSVAQVRPWLDGDPFLATGHMVCDLRCWYGPPGISEVYRRAAADPTRADSLEHYTLALMAPGPGATGGSARASRSELRRHLADLDHAAPAGRIVIAGAFEETDPLVGWCVYDTPDTAEARRWATADPLVAAERLRPELHPWMTARGILAH